MYTQIKYSKTNPIVALIIVTLIIIAFPLLSILALNALFPSLSIPITITTWTAMFWLMVVGGITVNRSK
jgi:hypothetical protein